MNHAYNLSGSAPVLKKYRVATGSSTNQIAGTYVTVAAANGSGVVIGLTTTVTEQVGHNLDAATGSTAPTADANALTTVLINPDAVYRLRMCGGATSGTALSTSTEQTGGSKTVHAFHATTDPDPNSPSMDEGTIFSVSGANMGQVRKITSVGANACTTTEGWVTANSAGDVFVVIPWTIGDTAGDNINLTSNLLEARQDIAVGTGADFRPIELQIDFSSQVNALRNSFVFAQMVANVLNTAT